MSFIEPIASTYQPGLPHQVREGNLFSSICLDPVLIEVHCLLGPEDPRWEDLLEVSIEIGYPGRDGKILWKRVGWIKDKTSGLENAFAHAQWSAEDADQVLEFDFLPVINRETREQVEKSYLVRKRLRRVDGRWQTVKTVEVSEGVYSDDYFEFIPTYPSLG